VGDTVRYGEGGDSGALSMISFDFNGHMGRGWSDNGVVLGTAPTLDTMGREFPIDQLLRLSQIRLASKFEQRLSYNATTGRREFRVSPDTLNRVIPVVLTVPGDESCWSDMVFMDYMEHTSRICGHSFAGFVINPLWAAVITNSGDLAAEAAANIFSKIPRWGLPEHAVTFACSGQTCKGGFTFDLERGVMPFAAAYPPSDIELLSAASNINGILGQIWNTVSTPVSTNVSIDGTRVAAISSMLDARGQDNGERQDPYNLRQVSRTVVPNQLSFGEGDALVWYEAWFYTQGQIGISTNDRALGEPLGGAYLFANRAQCANNQGGTGVQLDVMVTAGGVVHIILFRDSRVRSGEFTCRAVRCAEHCFETLPVGMLDGNDPHKRYSDVPVVNYAWDTTHPGYLTFPFSFDLGGVVAVDGPSDKAVTSVRYRIFESNEAGGGPVVDAFNTVGQSYVHSADGAYGCGDGFCDGQESTSGACPQDCGDMGMGGDGLGGTCGNGLCDEMEMALGSCLNDCGAMP
jgi:hypothetical protein